MRDGPTGNTNVTDNLFKIAINRICAKRIYISMTPDEVMAHGKSPQAVKARALLCFWAQRKLGMTTVEIAGKLSLSQSAVSRLSRIGEGACKETGAQFDRCSVGLRLMM
jgi:hypothetical protein